ncbi:MAG: helix-turn-helix transcriptional regulator [Rhodopseudomonas palustris]|uniref:Helix-turn-helix transcriptional regulator n=1 Tax=Rhodopseudomonas palustris TaxID=1076 RepID=A0A933RW55_RHOPL|nr:helix-turn-helix transcriptional regulator [Rhodopseudomonas palustris]
MRTRGERMVKAMQLRGMTKQHALAFAMGVNESTVTRWKNNRAMSVDHAVLLCRTLGISLDWLLTGCGDMDAPDHRRQRPSNDDSSFLSCMRRAETALTDQSRALLVSFIDSVLAERCPL